MRSLWLMLFLLAALPACAATIEGMVSKVHDGDSLWLAPDGKAPIVVRLRDIDAPEICQVYGAESRQALAELVLNRRATLKEQGRDPHGRTLGVLLVDGVDVGVRMVEEGHAWSIRTKWDQGPLVKQERMARSLSRGLHAQGGAVMPRDFRHLHGPCGNEPAASAVTTPAAAPMPAAPTARAPVARPMSPAPASNFRCDGRTRCTQMTSCEEARYFLANCPNVRMDGNNDGVPCEEQWCRRR